MPRYWLETFRLVREDREFFLDRFRAPTEHNSFDMVRGTGKGASSSSAPRQLGCSGGMGRALAASAWCTVAEVLKPRRMFEFFLEHRARLGMTIYPAEKGVTGKLVEAVEDGAVVAILGDRDLKGTGPGSDVLRRAGQLPAVLLRSHWRRECHPALLRCIR